jgi:hypothetical protein
MIQILELCHVNFFGHYFLDHIPNNPKHNFGIITPDLLRNFTPNLYDKNLLHHLKDSQWQSGVIKHFERDKHFHQSTFFEETYQTCHEITKNTFQKNQIPRFYFALHVLIEMILDKVLISQDENKLHEFYEQLELCQNEIPNLLEQIKHQNPSLFLERYSRFLESKYLFKYLNDSGIVYGFNRIYIQVNAYQYDWNEEQKNGLEELVPIIESAIQENITKLNS